MQKYFLAIVPNGPIQESATSLKHYLKEQMNVKYALKSPAHITLKMPFSYNEAKEVILIEKLSAFFSFQKSLQIRVNGTDTFGKRVIFWKVESDAKLYELQDSIKNFCKRELNLIDELSDRNYHPHMTIAFKDVKEIVFDQVQAVVTAQSVDLMLQVSSIELLKRIDNKWLIYHSFPLVVNG